MKTETRKLVAVLLFAFLGQTAGEEAPVGDAFLPDSIVTLMRKVNDHTRANPYQETDHPLAAEINSFLERQGKDQVFKPTGLGRKDYLDVIAGQVKAMRQHQDAVGRIMDPVVKREMYFATPCYAHSVAALAAEERKESWRRGIADIDITKAYRVYRKPYGAHEHGKFYKEYGKERANNWNLVNTAGEFDSPCSNRRA